MEERTKAAFDAVGESVKQLLALGTASIGATIALFDDGDVPGIELLGNWGVPLGLAFLALSVLFGLFALNTLAGQLGTMENKEPSMPEETENKEPSKPEETESKEPSIYAPNIRIMAFAQLAFFGLGILSLVGAVII
jgi:hypothetical protein